MSACTDAGQAVAVAELHTLLSGRTPADFRITTIGEAVAAIEAYASWAEDKLAGGTAAKPVAYELIAAAWYIAGAARQLVAEAQVHAGLALAAAEVTP